MATYTDVNAFRRDVWPAGANVDLKFVQYAAELSFDVINASLDKVYSVPFATTPGIIEKISDMLSRVVAEWLVSRGRLPTVGEVETQTGMLSPFKMLEALRMGEMDIPGETRKAATGASVNTADYMHIFDYDSAFGHVPDPDWITEAEDRRSQG